MYNDTLMTNNSTTDQDEACTYPQQEGRIMAAICIVMAIIGTALNGLVCFVIITRNRLCKIQNYLIANLSLGDLVLTSISLPLFAVYILAETQRYCMGIVSRVRGFLLNTAIVVSITTLSGISVERLVAIARPFQYKTIITHQRLLVAMEIIWAIACFYGAAIATNLHYYSAYATTIFDILSLSYIAICYMLMLVCYTIILIKSCRMTSLRKQMAPNQENSRYHTRVTMTIFLIVTSFTVTWVPFIVLKYLYSGKTYITIAELFAQSNAVINTLIYFYRTKEFQEELRKMFRKRKVEVEVRELKVLNKK